MASIYDFPTASQQYINRQRLRGGTVDPNVMGAFLSADLDARYADQKSRRAQDLTQQQINNQGRALDIQANNAANQYELAMKNYGLARDGLHNLLLERLCMGYCRNSERWNESGRYLS
ncbi:MAG TPA: hypothetical protein V6C97_26955 [Oculatellaceae cyanobacterium]